ncbi:Rha family transcriptional regulator [Lactobacillus delbrueckii]|uniref:Rha family transcriptional regulator n=1 Tax=Lactobacillus delbrueckii TaxID=1584 RepID=UPI001E334AA2|nr:Rha family transcriptional regulator [Lactobacillus delbrueckii]MCD5445407.1 Rha family transcriptional regulator [Lactobacillus delbrueckii subsp. lactis]
MNELVILKENKAVTTSLKVAESFGKRHRDVMRNISNLTAQNCAVGKMFAKSTYLNRQNHEQPIYYMNRDGFSLLVMGFTGKKALDFKLKYIDAFNKMEQTIKEGGLLASHLSPEEIQLKKAYIEEMRKQNDNKAHQLRNDDAKIFLQLAKVADGYDNLRLATEFRNEAINRMQALPVGGTREYSATEIAEMLGVSPVTIGTWANKLGVKHNRNMSYRDKAGHWHYYTSAVKLLEANALEIKDYEENHIEED